MYHKILTTMYFKIPNLAFDNCISFLEENLKIACQHSQTIA